MKRSVVVCTLIFFSLSTAFSARTQVEPASFHHLHLNSTDPSKAVDFYTGIFGSTSKTVVAGMSALRSESIHLLFDRVETAPIVSPDSAI